MTEIPQTDDLTNRMCRESDAAGGARVWLVHLAVLVLVAGGGVWAMFGVEELYQVSTRCESELLEFRELADRAARSPRRESAARAQQLRQRIQEQVWYHNMDGVRPRVLHTELGLRVRFAETVPSLEERQR